MSKKILRVLAPDGSVAIEFPVISGRNSFLGTKDSEGDQKTPRGEYYVCTINHRSQFYIFFGISYPGPDDAKKAMDKGKINRDEFERIMDAISRGKRPPWDTALGGEIGIHGGGIDRDGTRGCIGMLDEDCLALREYIRLGTRVIIEY